MAGGLTEEGFICVLFLLLFVFGNLWAVISAVRGKMQLHDLFASVESCVGASFRIMLCDLY